MAANAGDRIIVSCCIRIGSVTLEAVENQSAQHRFRTVRQVDAELLLFLMDCV